MPQATPESILDQTNLYYLHYKRQTLTEVPWSQKIKVGFFGHIMRKWLLGKGNDRKDFAGKASRGRPRTWLGNAKTWTGLSS